MVVAKVYYPLVVTSAAPGGRTAAFPWAPGGSIGMQECSVFNMGRVQPKQKRWPHTGSSVHCWIAQKQTCAAGWEQCASSRSGCLLLGGRAGCWCWVLVLGGGAGWRCRSGT